jgi:predicted nuclease of predicted toxin-antitoxin system
LARLKIYTDENVDIRVSEGLRRRGIKAFSAIEKEMVGASDIEHFKYASDLQAVIFTHDHHFLEIANSLVKDGKEHWGVIFVEMDRLSVGECISRLAVCAEVLTAEEMINRIEFL